MFLQDGGPGDDDLIANGVIVDPGLFLTPPRSAALQSDLLIPLVSTSQQQAEPVSAVPPPPTVRTKEAFMAPLPTGAAPDANGTPPAVLPVEWGENEALDPFLSALAQSDHD